MSYDLFFKSRQSGAKAGVGDIAAYFRQRGNYQVTDQQAIYQNEVTGVYFVFDLGDVGNDEDPDLLPISLNLNYFRPHIFGLEAEPEVRSFIEKFDLLVSDPQINGMGDGEYSTEKFLSGWNTGNEFGYRSVLQQHADRTPMMLPTSQIEDCWRWNYGQPELQQKLGKDVFVPRMMFMVQDGKMVSTVVWPDGIPSAVPQADVVLIPRKSILPKKFFRSSEDMVIAPWNTVLPILESFAVEQGALPYRLLNYSQTPEAVVTQLRSLAPTKEKPAVVPIDQVLNAELVEKARAK